MKQISYRKLWIIISLLFISILSVSFVVEQHSWAATSSYLGAIHNALEIVDPSGKERRVRAGDKSRCLWPLLGYGCASLVMQQESMTDMVLFRQILQAIENPCAYLVNPRGEVPIEDRMKAKWQAHANNAGNWRYLQCGEQNGREVKVILSIIKDMDREAWRLIKKREEE